MNEMKKIPCDGTMDHSLSLLFDGYSFIQNRCYKYKTDIFQTHILGQKAICMTGEDAAKVFYDNEYFKRKDVSPKRVQKNINWSKWHTGFRWRRTYESKTNVSVSHDTRTCEATYRLHQQTMEIE